MTLLDKIDRAILKSIKVTHTVEHTPPQNTDSLEIGTPGRKGTIKVYGDFNDPDTFKLKIEKAILIQEFANLRMYGQSMDQSK